jgi:exodeoxyribonuclease V beta subunit
VTLFPNLREPAPFDVCGDLPVGMTLLEASAGTGKTFTIAALAARYVADGLPLEKLLVVTFTRMATGELRERVRERLLTVAEGLGLHLADGELDGDDEIVELLATGAREDVEKRHGRLLRAVADFDAATIDTTHGFCLHMLSELGVAGDVEPDAGLVEDVDDLLEEVVDDLYVRRFWASQDRPPFSRVEAIRIGRAVLGNPGALVVPPLVKNSYPDGRTAAAIRRRLAKAITEEIDRRKRALKILTYDDLVTRLRDTLADPVRGPAACRRLRDRYSVVLVDEFQDTDPIQWEVMERAFAGNTTTLVLIGDPKQAIYSFRGADVYAYLKAAAAAESRSTLKVNWRSDQGLVDAFDALFKGTQLGHAGILYRSVEAALPNRQPGLKGAPCSTPLRFRVLERKQVPRTPYGYAAGPVSQLAIAGDLANEVVAILRSRATIRARRPDAAHSWSEERVRPSHLAVLVRTNRQARLCRDALHDAGVPAVLGGSGSVFGGTTAAEWLLLLEALDQPTHRGRAAAAALTVFGGWSAEEVATASDESWEDLHWRLHRWSNVLRRRGIAALSATMTETQQLPARILGRPGGERILTDLRHISHLLHEAAMAENLGTTALIGWLRRRIAEADRDADDVDRSLRLESDAEAVQVLTIHRSKGLEFPIVYCPFLWDNSKYRPEIPVFHDPGSDDRRTIDVGGDEAPSYGLHCNAELVELRGEDLRLLYVALTRACHQAVVWWAGSFDSRDSPLGRLLCSRDEFGVVAPQGKSTPADAAVTGRLNEVAARSGGQVSVETVSVSPVDTWQAGPASQLGLVSGEFNRVLDDRWRRSSYSGITALAHAAASGSGVASEPDEGVLTDEPAAESDAAGSASEEAVRTAEPLALGAMQSNADVGTLIHTVMEGVDFSAPDLGASLRSCLEAQLARRRLDLGSLDTVVAGLHASIEAPLGPLTGGLRLRDVTPANRRDELAFELPLVGGDTTTGTLSVTDIADLLRAHLDAGDPLFGYADRLGDPSLNPTLRGYLTGSLDLVWRAEGSRYFIADYKTNRLAPRDETLTTWHYRPAALEAEMYRAHYPLQALLYTVALHRYLRWRLAGYDPSRHLAGVLYLFLRGMSGPPGAMPAGEGACGVWAWRPPATLIEALSDLFDQGSVAS